MTHGRGKKGGRGAGLRGGRGKAGWGKHRRMHMEKVDPNHFGSYGFKRPQSVIKKTVSINIGEIEVKFPNKTNIDLTEEGYTKLLGAGKLSKKLKIKVEHASEKAIEKVKNEGGEVVLPK